MAFNEINTKHFCVFYETIDNKYAKDIIDPIDDFYDKIASDFGMPNCTIINLYLCPNVESYIKLTNKTKENYQDWMIGWSDPKLRKICILSPRIVKDRTYKELKKIICHEIVHIAFDGLTNSDDAGLRLSEGIATLLANQIELEYVDKQSFPLLKDLCGEDDFVDNGGYDYCRIYVWYFIQKYGMNAFINVYTGKRH